MRNYFGDGWNAIKKVLIDDSVNLYLFLGSLIILAINYTVWTFVLSKRELFVYENLGIYPLRYLVIVLVLNTTLALFSYDKEKEISYLLLAANIGVSCLVFVLEIFYLFNS